MLESTKYYSRLENSNSEISSFSETTIISNIPKKIRRIYAKILKKDLGGCYLPWSFFAGNILKLLWMNKNVFSARSVTLIVQDMYRLSITAIIHILFHTLEKKYRKLDKSK